MLHRIVALLAACFLAMFAAPVAAQGDLPTVELTPGQSAPSLHGYLRYTHDAPRTALDTIDPEVLATMRPLKHSSLQFGRVNEPVLAMVRLHNSSDRYGNWILTTGRGSVSSFRMYRVEPDGLVTLIDNSDSRQLGETLWNFQALATQVSLGGGESATYAIQFTDENSSYMPVAVRSLVDYFHERRENLVLVSAVFFGSLILIFFNVVLYYITGQRAFVWLGAAEIAFAINTLHAEGYTTILVLYAYPEWQSVFGEISRCSFALLMVQFGRVFLGTERAFPRFDRALRAMVWVGAAIFLYALASAFVPALQAMALHAIGWLYIVVVSLTLPFLGALAVRHLGKTYWPLLAAWTVMAFYISYSAVAISGIVPAFKVNWHWVGPIGLFECAMATLALGLHLRQLYYDRIHAERAAKEVVLENLAVTTEAARMAEERARAHAALEARNKLIQASGHDTRHVLHALNSAIHFSRRAEGGTLPREELTKLIEASARHLDEIVATSVSAFDRERPFVALGAVDLERTLRDIDAIYRQLATDAGIALTWRETLDRPVLTDGALVARIVSNLINNALKFTPAGTVSVETHASLGSFVIRVADSGTGMPQPIIDRLLDFTVPVGERCRAQGFGTGWRAICESVEFLEGFYTIHSDRNGTVVEIELPDPLSSGEPTPTSIEELARKQPDIALVDADEGSRSEVRARIAAVPRGTCAIAVTADETSAQRMWLAEICPLMLVKPLCREMLRHPCVKALQTRPAALPSSTS